MTDNEPKEDSELDFFVNFLMFGSIAFAVITVLVTAIAWSVLSVSIIYSVLTGG